MLKVFQKIGRAAGVVSFAMALAALTLLSGVLGCGGANTDASGNGSVVVNMATDPALSDKTFIMTINNQSTRELGSIGYQTITSTTTTDADGNTTTVNSDPVPHTIVLSPTIKPGSSVAATFVYDEDLGKNRFFSLTVNDSRNFSPQAFTVRIFPDGSADPADGVFNYVGTTTSSNP